MRSLSIATAPRRDSLHWQQSTISWDDLRAWLDSPARKKEAGNYLLGALRSDTTVKHKGEDKPCTGCHRRKDFVVFRSAITLDVDFPRLTFIDDVEMVFPYRAIIHSTYSSSPDEPRYRLIVFTDRDMTPDEYVAAATSVVNTLGAEQFDPGTTQPERYMFRPSAKQPEWFVHRIIDGDPLPVDTVLEGFVEDLSSQPTPKPHRNKRDPYSLEGVIGAFNRAYADDWDLLIQEYELPYERVDDDRYQLVGSRAQAGMGPVPETEGLVYSHHTNDPAYGKTCSAFDLVRLHLFSHLDEGVDVKTPINRLPSQAAMLETASVDARVTAELVGVDFDEDLDDLGSANDWKLGLRLAPRSGRFLDTIHNWDLLAKHDPVFGLLYFNELSLSVEVSSDLPWRKVTENSRTFGNTDRWEMCYYIERTYNIRPSRGLCDSLVDTKAGRNMVNPVRDYLETLIWDGTSRIETCLPGVVPTTYTRLVARKSLVAAVARMFNPGCKWDHTLVLYGDEGLGKSWWIDRVSRGYSASLGRVGDKDTLLTMQRSWIMVSDEGHSLRKGDADMLKEFLTRTEDIFRMPYDRETMVHPRHCVIWSTTNDETFLRRQQGNRRFLIVHCQEKVDFDAMTDAYVDQLWAEALHLYRAGEHLFLGETESKMAAVQRERFVEEDALAGVIEEYLETPVPQNWWDMSKESRYQWLADYAQGFERPGSLRIDQTCSTQIWVEAMGRRIGDHRRSDLLDITNAIKRIPGWTALPGRRRFPGYGSQMVFVREGTEG